MSGDFLTGGPDWGSDLFGDQGRSETPEPKPEPTPADLPPDVQKVIAEAKDNIHRTILETVDFEAIQALPREQAEAQFRATLEKLVKEQPMLASREREILVQLVLDEVFGLGPLEPLLNDASISDILINTCNQVWVERAGKLQVTKVRFRDEAHLRQTLDRIVSAVGRRIDESSPMVDARLLDGSRVNAVIPPIAIDGTHISIRKFKRDVLGPDALLNFQSLTAEMLEVLKGAVQARLNLIVSGGTGSGKTTLLNILSSFIPHDERVVTIEDSAELQMRQPHVVRLETRPANAEGSGSVDQRQLVVNALRMRPERIILGEVRSAEAVDLLQAMNTGHDGSMGTLHANTPRDAIARMETMIAMANLNLADRAMRAQIASALHLIVQANRMADGSRKITSITEVTGMEGEILTMQEIFRYVQTGMDPDTNKVVGYFEATGIRPRFADKLSAGGIELPENLFLSHEERLREGGPDDLFGR